MSSDPNRCSLCYDAAKKAGRAVRMTEIYPYKICQLCENRLREGLVFYIPSNGTEAMIFQERCERCRNCSEHKDHGYATCAFGILDRILDSACEESDGTKRWHDPLNIRTEGDDGKMICPAECLRFKDRNEMNGERFDPPPKDCEGQMTFDDVLVVEERAPQRTELMEIEARQ